MSYRVEYEKAEEGLVAYVSGGIASFSFRVGEGEIEVTGTGDSFLWTVKNDGGRHCLQLILHPLPEHFLSGEEPPEEILASHMRWAAEFQAERFGRQVTEGKYKLGYFPTGEPILSWRMDGETPQPQNESSDQPTAVTAHASTLHDGHVLMYTAQGFGEGWNRERLETKCLRAALSVFRHG